MNIKYIQKQLEVIEGEKRDDERAHADLDDLYIAVLQAIADGTRSPRKLATEALKGEEIDFARWCA